MCGLVAIWSPNGDLDEADLGAPLRALRHRGPDADGTWLSPSRRTALGHARLAVVDLVTGDQPIGDHEGRFHIAAVGEFYGYEKIRGELARSGYRFRTRSDSEVAMHLYARDGVDAMHRLRGEFAFAVWDEWRGELFLARDRFGVKPLFYAEHRGRIYFASEVKALLACGLAPRWDVGAFADHLLAGFGADRTLYDGVRQLPPGCTLLASGAGITVRPYWDLDYPAADEVSDDVPGPAHHLEEVRAAVHDAVRVRMTADVPVGFHLSGGVDSSVVVGAAAQHGPVRTFTVGFGDPAHDERGVARRTAARFGTRHTEIEFADTEFERRVGDVTAAGEMIQENSHGIARYLQSATIRAHGYKAVLAGEGGDEIFCGYPHFARDLAVSVSPRVRAGVEARFARLGPDGLPPHLEDFRDGLGFVPHWILLRHLEVTQPLLPLLDRDFVDLLTRRRPASAMLGGENRSAQLRGRAPLHQSMYLFARSWLANYILAAERLDMAHGLEVRLPLLDHHVHEVAKRTPLRGYAGPTRLKAVLRDAMRDDLPVEVADGTKQPFSAPPAVRRDAALDRLRQVVADGTPFFDRAKVTALIDRAADTPPDRRDRYERVLQIVVGVALLDRRLGLSGPAGGTETERTGHQY